MFTRNLRKTISDKKEGTKKNEVEWNINLRHRHAEYLKKYFFCFPDLRNFYVIRYFTNCTKGTNKRLFPLCGSCGFVSKKPNHGANKCTKLLTEEKRKDIIGQIEAIFFRNNMETKKTLYEYLQAIYYTMDDIINKDRTRLI